jgi:hypothetical protein
MSSSASRAATNVLNRALSIASQRLFGHSPSPGHSCGSLSQDCYTSPGAPSLLRRPRIITLDPDAERDLLEDELLASQLVSDFFLFLISCFAVLMFFCSASALALLVDTSQGEKQEFPCQRSPQQFASQHDPIQQTSPHTRQINGTVPPT